MAKNILNNFHPAISSWFKRAFSHPSPPQTQGWPEIAAGKHTLILAPTGSGKTLAAFLWCIDDIFRSVQKSSDICNGVHTLYISPLKALNNDIHRNLQAPLTEIQKLIKKSGQPFPGIRAMVRTGDTPSHVRQAMVKNPPHILITTPESLYLLLTSERGREIFRDLRYLIIDEIHALSNNKRGVHLSLSIERLMPLCRQEPVRIGLSATQRPLKRIAAFLGGQTSTDSRPRPRAVSIVDCGQRKDLDLKVISPVESFSDLPDATVWPAVIDKLYTLITSHQTTLVFANMRAQTERIARLLNEKHQDLTGTDDAILALAHHGSISREARYDIEARLKGGKIPAVIATASLELGIDIGSIDLVVQLEAPRNVSSGLQRVGRSGHVLSATSKGRIIPMYPSDLDNAVSMVQLMHRGEIEETHIPENCLDVLAQQIVAELAMRNWPREELYHLFTRSYCYRALSMNAFNEVLEMLAGRFAGAPIRNLRPRISWDRVNDVLAGLKGSRLLAIMNSGTIPDRGYYAVYLADSNIRLGEMEEEFVFESRVGHVFYLGNNEWRIQDIRQDRIIVTPVKTIKPRAPFWKGDTLYRAFESSLKIGAFRRHLLEQVEHGSLAATDFLSDQETLASLCDYIRRQQEATGKIPTDKMLLAEWFRDSADEPHIILHTCFGARVNGLWAMAIAAQLEQQHGAQVQYSYSDEGMVIRMLDTAQSADIKNLISLQPDKIENLLIEALLHSPVFSVRFRYNAARALILTRSQPNKRIPLWLQRLRAADLLQVVREYPNFPILAETLRDCLQEVFDLSALKRVLADLEDGKLGLHIVHSPVPSPMASGLMFDFLSENLYETDRSRLPAQIASVSNELLADILNQGDIPAIVTREIIKTAEQRWQHLSPESNAKEMETFFAVIEKLAPLSTEALQKRANIAVEDWLPALEKAGRIRQTKQGWIASQDKKLFEKPTEAQNRRELLRRFLRARGPVTIGEIAAVLQITSELLEADLTTLQESKEVVSGFLIQDEDKKFWCDSHNFSELYRRAISERRNFAQPVARNQLYVFLLAWHKIDASGQSFQALLNRYIGFRMPLSVLDRELLRSRLAAREPALLGKIKNQLKEQIRNGNFIIRAYRENEQARLQVDLSPRGTGHLFNSDTDLPDPDPSGDGTLRVLAFLRENGASLLRDIESATELSAVQLRESLWQLTRMGLLSTDDLDAFFSILQTQPEKARLEKGDSWLPGRNRPDASRRRRGRRLLRETVRQQVQHADSRWFLTSAFAVMGKPVPEKERAERQARLLLQRHGVLVKEWYRREQGFLPWYQLFQALRRMEWQGEIRRGYFVQGLSGVQFALPEAIELLEKIQRSPTHSDPPILLSTIDPALPFGAGFDWQMRDGHGAKLSITRLQSNHFVFLKNVPVFYSENYASRIFRLAKIPATALDACVSAFKTFLRVPAEMRARKKIEVREINNQPAANCKLAEVFLKNGFEKDGLSMVLWPSAV